MTINQAIRILDPETTAEELATIEYYGGLHGREKMVAACDEACRMAVEIMRQHQVLLYPLQPAFPFCGAQSYPCAHSDTNSHPVQKAAL